MLREPRQIEKVEKVARTGKGPKKDRFQVVRLEERIAPCHGGTKGKCGSKGSGGI
jgi:hypothetical protein